MKPQVRSIRKPRSLFNNRLTSWQKVERPLLLLTVLLRLKNADRIIVVTEDGLTEDGTHEELLAKKRCVCGVIQSTI